MATPRKQIRGAKPAGQTAAQRSARLRQARRARSVHRRHGALGRNRLPSKAYAQEARRRLRGFFRATKFTVGLTAILLIFWTGWETSAQEAQVSGSTTAAVEQATGTLRGLLVSFRAFFPKILIAILILIAAAMIARLARWVIGKSLPRWPRASAIKALTSVAIFLIGLGSALSVIAGDARALVGSVGLVGLALSWALQAPIESFTGWLLNSFKGYYRIGDRIEVGEVFGDVYDIDVLTTTVWEAGGPGKPVQGAQPTGALITFPNSEVLRANIVNYTRDFPYVWDEVTVGIANESDLGRAVQVARDVAKRVVGREMLRPAKAYRGLLRRRHLPYEVPEEPQVFLAPSDAWTNLTVRYLIATRARRKWASALYEALSVEMARPEHSAKIIPAYPRTEISVLPTREPFRDSKQEPGRGRFTAS